jgi:hypothetical protein
VLENRQNGQCPQCSVIQSADSSCPNDACFCSTLVSLVASCTPCLATVDPASVTNLVQVLSECYSVFPSFTTLTNTTTQSSHSDCSACDILNAASASCPGNACFCPTLSSFASLCTSCLSTVYPANITNIESAWSACTSEYPQLTPPPSLVAQCSACSVIATAASSCSNDACFCPTLISLGTSCTNCALTINGTFASLVGVIISECESEVGPGSTSSMPSGPVTILSTVVSTTTVAAFSGTTSRSNARDRFSPMNGLVAIQFIMFLGFMAGLFCVFA